MRIKFKRLQSYKYLLEETYALFTELAPPTSVNTPYLEMGTNGRLVVRRGYAWNGDPGPVPDCSASVRASLVRDALYQLIRAGLVPGVRYDQADTLHHRLCLEDGLSKLRAGLRLLVLKCFRATHVT